MSGDGNTESTIVESTWQQALAENNGDYAYHNSGGMISEENGSYTVRSGDLQAACAGDWSKVERVSLAEEDIPQALEELKMSLDGWSYE